MAALSWSTPFDDPIPLPDGREILTLEDAARYILTLGDREAKSEPWKVAGEALIMAAEDRGPVMHARIGMLRAINHGKPRPAPQARKKAVKAYRLIP